MLVSIITPCFNAEKYIKQTIESVLSQSYQNWEMLIIDDCSTDRSAEIIRNYCSRYNQIKYFKTDKNSGTPTNARNIGIKNARGRFIGFLDSDDIWLSTKLERQISLFELYPDASIVFSDYEKFSEDGMRTGRIVICPDRIDFNTLLYSNVIGCLTGIYDQNRVGKRYFKDVVHEDYVFWLDILKDGGYAYNVGEIMALYRVNKKSFSSNKIKAIFRQWETYRNSMQLNVFYSSKYLIVYMIQTFIKYLK